MNSGVHRILVISAFAAAKLVLTGPAASQSEQQLEEGEQVYNNYCFTCHGERLVSSGQTFDLRRLRSSDRPRFDTAVRDGKGQMPPWKGVLGDGQIEALWAYIRANAFER